MAIKPPKVQTLSEAMADLNPAYAASKKIVNKKIDGLGDKYTGQKMALTAKKGQAFNTINNQATGRGMSFSGIPLDEQATYMSTEYLPGMQKADYQQNQESLEYQGQLAGMDKEQRLQGISRIDSQKKDLNTWNLAEKQRRHQAEQARLDRQFKERMAAQDRSFQERMNNAKIAAQRAATAAADAPMTMDEYLRDAFAKGYSGDNVKNFWTEKVLAGNLASTFNLSHKEAARKAINYRRKYYGS